MRVEFVPLDDHDQVLAANYEGLDDEHTRLRDPERLVHRRIVPRGRTTSRPPRHSSSVSPKDLDAKSIVAAFNKDVTACLVRVQRSPAGAGPNAEAVTAVGSSSTSNSRTARSANAGFAAIDRYRSVSRVRSADTLSAKR